jgi:hypothetical protein
MLVRYIIFLVIYLAANAFFLYYIIIFCAIYPSTSLGWMISCVICLLFKFLIAEMFGPMMEGLIRKFVQDGDR